MFDITDFIRHYYAERGLVMPNLNDAIHFQDTEKAEFLELLLSRDSKYVRNNPHTKEPYSNERAAEELGDQIMMILVQGMILGIDPIEALKQKLNRKLKDLGLKPYV